MEPKDLVYDICRAYISDQIDVDDVVLARVSGYLRARDIQKLSTCSELFDQLSHSVIEWRFLRQVEAFFKKNAIFAHASTCFEAAKDSFFQNEASCSETNRRLKPFVEGDESSPFQQEVYVMQHYIRDVLGDFTRFEENLSSLIRVTPGATAQTRRVDSIPQLKMKMKLYSTSRAHSYLRSIYESFGFDGLRLRKTHSNRVELVPKNWKTHRTIACEPEGNLPLQLAVDKYVKRRLRRFGLNLSDQSANQRKAKHASIHNDYATVDLRAASDTISFNTVNWLLPEEWFSYMSDIRSPGFRGVFGEGVYSKFSSMGNGYTFVLETLIFAAVCHAVGARDFLVYGDDVIIEKKLYPKFVALAQFLGFAINAEKSFSEGPFRESCGGDYYFGTDVTPVYIRGVDARKAFLCHLVNTLGSLTFPGSKLGVLLSSLIKEFKLPLVPWNQSTLSGVWIDVRKARDLGILRHRVVFKSGPCLDYFKAYVPKYRTRVFSNCRGYYLWFLARSLQARQAGPWDFSSKSTTPSQTSSVPIFQHAYVRKWVCWREPAEAIPDHILWLENETPAS